MVCKARTEVYSRVVGYYRPVDQWNLGKRAEFKDRVPFNLTNPTGNERNQNPMGRMTRRMCNVGRLLGYGKYANERTG